MNRLFVVNKPINQSSNSYMRYIKRKYNTKKVGFSGILDPFATGCLIVGTGQYTKLFQYLNKTPKVYRATLWLGASSSTLDIEKVDHIENTPKFDTKTIEDALYSLKGDLTYYPPKYSAKKIDGQRAYDLARSGKDINLKQITSIIYDIKLIHYNHPFIHFEATVSEGTYIRSLGSILSDTLGCKGALSSLYRVSEGCFYYDHEKPLDPFKHLKIPKNRYIGDHEYIELGKKLSKEQFEDQSSGIYLVETDNFYAIIEICDSEVRYKLNRIEKPTKDTR